ncbi:MAG: carbon storage regulator [Patescibacteria group bacterium]|nr:carbon storage regulator [Patescibacteria group bacterium]
MLVLARKEGEKVDIAPNIVVTVLEVRSDEVRLGFEAPDDIKILRRELRLRDEALDNECYSDYKA